MKRLIIPIFGFLLIFFMVIVCTSSVDTLKSDKKRRRKTQQEVIREVVIDSVFIIERGGVDEHKLLQIHSVTIPDEITFCGENVPVNIYYVRESLERELLVNSYLHATTLQNIKRANRFFPIIEPILKKNNVPDDMKYLAVAESNLMNVISAAKATGVWQFMKETAKLYSLEVNDHIDERYNLEKSTEAACEYLIKMYQKFGSWATAAAAYNMGFGNLSKAINHQKDSIYFNLNLNAETARYVYRILAMKIIFEHPQDYGFYIRNNELYPVIPTQILEVDTTISNLTQFAFDYEINYRMLKEFNPWLRSYTLPNKSQKVYKIIIPQKGFTDYHQNLKMSSDTTWFEGFLTH